MKKTIYKTETANILVKYVITIVISAVLLAAASLFNSKSASTVMVMIYVLSVASALCISTLQSIEAIMDKRFKAELLRNIAVIVLLFCGAYKTSALIAIIFCFSDMISHYLNISASKAYIKCKGLRLCYTSADGASTVFAEDLKAGDSVIICDGDFLCFDGVLDGGAKQYSGIYSGGRKKIAVTQVYDYSADFESAVFDRIPLCKYIKRYYPIAVLLIAVIFAAVKLILPHITLFGALISPAAVLLLCMPEMILSGIAVYFAKFGDFETPENLNGVKNIVVNMTGALTKGELSVGDIVCKQGYEAKDVISMCAAVQPDDGNKYAKAFLNYLGVSKTNTVSSKVLPHLGITAEISGRAVLVGSEKLMNINNIDCSEFDKYTVFVAVDGTLIAAIKMNDTLISSACAAMHELKAAGYNTYIVTANNSLTAKAVAENCNAEYTALCDDKAEFVNSLKQSGKTLYIGDDDFAIAAGDAGMRCNGGDDSFAAVVSYVKSAKTVAARTKIRMAVGAVIAIAIIALIMLNVIRAGWLWGVALLIAAVTCLPKYLAANSLEK